METRLYIELKSQEENRYIPSCVWEATKAVFIVFIVFIVLSAFPVEKKGWNSSSDHFLTLLSHTPSAGGRFPFAGTLASLFELP